MADEKTNPKVFFSYSHDSEDYKNKVREIADKLRAEHGIDVQGDFYEEDLAYGELIDMFMESVNNNELIVCFLSPRYKMRADEGIGGVGYESRIITQPLYAQVGSQKVLPIVLDDELPLHECSPKFMSIARKTMMRREFPDDDSFIEALARAIYKKPKKPKPFLGKSKFLENDEQNTQLKPLAQNPLTEDINQITSPQNYKLLKEHTLYLADRNQDREFHQMLRNVKRDVFEKLKKLLNEQRETIFSPGLAHSIKNNELPDIMEKYVEIIAPLFVIAFSAMQSRREKYMHQNVLICEIASINDWQHYGVNFSVAERIPEFLGFLYHHLHGAILVDAGVSEKPWDIVEQKILCNEGGRYKKISEVGGITAWPHSLGGNSGKSFTYLLDAYSRWGWLKIFFHNEEEYKVALTAYSMGLNLFNYFLCLTKDTDTILFPSNFYLVDSRIRKLAEDWLVRNNRIFQELMNDKKISLEEALGNWPQWVNKMVQAGSGYFRIDFFMKISLKDILG